MILAISALVVRRCANTIETRVHVVEPGKIIRGAWQRPEALRNLVEREHIRTVVTLTAINTNDSKYGPQEQVLREKGVRWRIIPMRGSTATLEQLDEALALISNPANQPVFFHCVGGHHRSNLVHAAYLIRARGMGAGEAWSALAALPWTRPGAARDQDDRRLVFEYEKHNASHPPRRLAARR